MGGCCSASLSVPGFLMRAPGELACAEGQGAELQAALEQGDDLNTYCCQEPQKGASAPHIPFYSTSSLCEP